MNEIDINKEMRLQTTKAWWAHDETSTKWTELIVTWISILSAAFSFRVMSSNVDQILLARKAVSLYQGQKHVNKSGQQTHILHWSFFIDGLSFPHPILTFKEIQKHREFYM